MKVNTKFFKAVTNYGVDGEFYGLYVCHKDTPIPTAKQLVEQNNLNPCCENDEIVEISMEEFLELHHQLLTKIIDSAEDMMEWSPNYGNVSTWEWWDGIEED